MDRTSLATQAYEDNNKNLVELEALEDIDSFYAAPAKRDMERGHHVVRLVHYEVVPAKTVQTRYDVYTTKQYILLDLVDSKNGEVISTRLYAGFVPYFMDAIKNQTAGNTCNMKLSEVLKYLGAHDFDIWVSYSREFGVQVNYREPRS